MIHGLRAAALAAGFGTSLATLALADTGSAGGSAYLETGIPVLGGSTDVTVRSPLVGGLAIVAVDGAVGSLFAGNPTLPVLCLSPTFSIGAFGTVDSSGRFQASLTTPAFGTSFYAQAVVIDSGTWHASNCVGLIAGAPSTASFTDGTAGLDFDTFFQSAADVDWVDINKDGCMDVVVANDGTGATPFILIGDCSGDFSNEAEARLPLGALRPTSTIEVGDVNNDSWPDLFLGGGAGASSPLPNLLAINDGAGNFTISTTAASAGLAQEIDPCLAGTCGTPGLEGQGLAVDAEFGDVDGDGDLDLIVVNIQDPDFVSEVPDPVVLYLNRGSATGSFVEDAAFSTLPDNQSHTGNGDASLGDVDNDGDLDVFICADDFQNQLYVNDGTGSFTDQTATALLVEVDKSFEGEFGDFDGDGDLDIFVANSIATDTTAIHLYENQTTVADSPVFVDSSSNIPVSFGLVTDVRLGTAVGDVDNDGDLDIYVAIHELPRGSGNDGETILLLNQGGAQGGTQGTFDVDPGFLSGLFIEADIALGDADDDGDLDLYIANSGNLFQFDFHDELWINDL